MVIQPITRITAEAYFQLDDYIENDLIQLINGDVVISMLPIIKHQRIVRQLLIMFSMLADKIGGEALDSPIEVYLDQHNIFEPDVLYMTPDSQCTIGEKRIVGAPELIVEVLSPSTAKYDKREKYAAYEQHGVQEYWIVDPVHELIEVWTLQAGSFVHQGVYDKDDTFTSSVLTIDVEVKPILNV